MSKAKMICSICQRDYTGWSCNAWPVNDGRCCQYCDDTVVVPARIRQANRAATKVVARKSAEAS